MKIYLITDTHFFHDKMPLYCGRPENHTEVTGGNLLKLQVEPSDALIHLGDICVGHDEKAHELYIRPLKCKKWLVRGNHDNKSDSWYLNHGWDWVGYKMQGRYFGKNVLFSHCPERFLEVEQGLWGAGNFDLNIHGHFHNTLHRLQEGKWATPDEKERNAVDLANITERHKLLAIEYTEYKPVLLEHFIQQSLR